MAVKTQPFRQGPSNPFTNLYAQALFRPHLQLPNRKPKETYQVPLQDIARATKTRRFYSNERFLRASYNE